MQHHPAHPGSLRPLPFRPLVNTGPLLHNAQLASFKHLAHVTGHRLTAGRHLTADAIARQDDRLRVVWGLLLYNSRARFKFKLKFNFKLKLKFKNLDSIQMGTGCAAGRGAAGVWGRLLLI